VFGKKPHSCSVPYQKEYHLKGTNHCSSQEESTTSEGEGESSKESNGEDTYPCEGNLLIIRRLINNQPNLSHITQGDAKL